ncbi:helix-turn-helix domain-containing protein [Streptomyces sp. VRA16 Mangrove soil]|uniref:helix-turn-helix domain-containing protein n=1 Tax=Streptomyces sp. VRA16 Mangrove soil TaxID=2817434 RepID=UPI001A9E0616|nr:helix-turn-helix transcriptional regulator [Streptomyces sp. VRA16 Mangrove soil]MBO1332867.1 helix-turn-helix transcriptional regulator [Streptomyces sp. VRA16 Mangrove soil]
MGLNDEVGRRLKGLRQDAGLTLSELARRSGVGKGTLSELESGRRNPTLETLYALTTVLGRPLSAVLDDPPHGATEGVSGSAVTAVLIERYEDADAATDVFRITIAEGAVQESAAHVARTTESLMVLSGTAVVGPPDALRAAGPGAHAHWPADAPHVYSAPHGEVHGILFVRYTKG